MRQNPYLSVGSVILSAALTALGNGMMATFVPVRLNAESVGQDLVGMVVTAYAVGMLLGCIYAGRIVRRVGHIRAFTAFAAIGTISALLMPIHVAPLSWMVLRVAGGVCTTAMFMAAQSWLNEVTRSEHRGRVMSLFYLSYTVSLGLGALVMNRVSAESLTPLLILAGLYAAAVVPVALTRLETPPPRRISVRLLEVYRISPVGLVGAYVAGSLGMTMMGVGPMYGNAIGLSGQDIALMMAALQGGNLVIQWPLGWLSDRVDRRLVISGAAAAVVFVSAVLLAAGTQISLPLLVVLFGLWGGLAESIYAVSTAHTNDRTEPGNYVVVSSTILVVWATGSTVGPVVATGALRAFGADGLWLFFIAAAVAFAFFVIWRSLQRPQPAEEMQAEFRALPASPRIPEWYPGSDDEPGIEPADPAASER